MTEKLTLGSAGTLPAVLPWSLPERRKEDKELPSIPVELYIAIFSHLDPHDPYETSLLDHKRTLAALCLVCRMFSLECQPRLFRSVRHTGTSSSVRHGKSLQLWSKSLVDKDPRSILLASFVHEYTLSSWFASNDSSQWYFTAFLTQRMSTALHFVNLKTLALKRCQIRQSTFIILAQMQSLHSISLNECVTAWGDNAVNIRSSRTGCTHFSSARTLFPSEWYHLLSTFINIDGLEYLSVDDWSLALAIFEERRLDQLHELHISIYRQDTPSLLGLLEQTPNLTRLCIRNNRMVPCPPLASHIVPHLQQLEADSNFINRIVPGRPVTYIKLLGEENYPQESIFSALKRSTSSVRSMCLPQQHFRTLGSHEFPHLESLTISPRCVKRIKPYSTAMRAALVRDSPIPSLELVTLDPDPACCRVCATLLVDLYTQRASLARKFSSIFPNTTRLRMADIIEWRRDMGQAWIPHVLSKPAAKELLLREDIRDISDVHGCLRSIFRDDELTSEDRLRLGDAFKLDPVR